MRDRCEEEIPLRRSSRQRAGRPKKEVEPELPRIPRVARLMALAIKFQEMIDRGEVRDYADLARLGYVTRARVTQIMNLTLLAPSVQEELLLGDLHSQAACWKSERGIRQLAGMVRWSEQAALLRSRPVAPSSAPRSTPRCANIS